MAANSIERSGYFATSRLSIDENKQVRESNDSTQRAQCVLNRSILRGCPPPLGTANHRGERQTRQTRSLVRFDIPRDSKTTRQLYQRIGGALPKTDRVEEKQHETNSETPMNRARQSRRASPTIVAHSTVATETFGRRTSKFRDRDWLS